MHDSVRARTLVMSVTASARQLHFPSATSLRRWIVITRFVDSKGRDWMVREVKDPNLAMIPPYLLTDPEFARGWLLFESSGEKRRLAPYPDDWIHLSVPQLEESCLHATRLEPLPSSSTFLPVARAAETTRM
jgi:hypothetical protein